MALAAVFADLQESSPAEPYSAPVAYTDGCLQFFREVFSPDTFRANQFAERLAVLPSTFISRFYRAGLPSPKRYVAFAQLVWVAHLGETTGLSIARIADRMHASSPQALGRSIRTLTGFTASQFRYRFSGETMLRRFVAELITPYRDKLRMFDPMRWRLESARESRQPGDAQLIGAAQPEVPHVERRAA